MFIAASALPARSDTATRLGLGRGTSRGSAFASSHRVERLTGCLVVLTVVLTYVPVFVRQGLPAIRARRSCAPVVRDYVAAAIGRQGWSSSI